MRPATSSIQLDTGVTLPYREHGDPAGTPMILLHGYSDSLHSFDLLAPHLPESLRAIAVTQRGHGDADRPDGGYTPEQHAADAAAVLDALGLEAALVVGHSAGGYTAQRFALDHTERTLGIALIAAFRGFDADNAGVGELREAVEALADPVDPGFVRDFQESCFAEPVPTGFIDAVVAESLKLPARVWKAFLRGLLEAEAPSEAGTIAAPTLILWGDRDAFILRADQEALAAAIPGAELVVYEGVGHCPHWERPERTAADLAAFARRATAAQMAASTF
jgi:pimeloyl-ACP methyl ester carboxylesterase